MIALTRLENWKCHLTFRFGEGYVVFLRFGQPVSATDLRRAILKYLPQAMISSRQATAARLLLPRSQDTTLSVSFSMVKLLAEELKATDYTLTQSSLDQVSESNSTKQRCFADSQQFWFSSASSCLSWNFAAYYFRYVLGIVYYIMLIKLY